MPYESSKFCNLSKEDLYEYEKAFANLLTKVVDRFTPDIIHSHHLVDCQFPDPATVSRYPHSD